MCPVNYSRSKLSGNEVPGSSPGPFSRLLSVSVFLLLSGYLARHCPTPAGHPPVERERTNKSARALRRDIVSCKVNHLRGSKTASSPRRDLLSSPREASRRRLLPRARCFCTILSVQAHRHFFSLPFSSSRPPRSPRHLRHQRVFLVVSPVSVNMRTHSLVISVIGSLMPARAESLTRTAPARIAGLDREAPNFSKFSAHEMLLSRYYANVFTATRMSQTVIYCEDDT